MARSVAVDLGSTRIKAAALMDDGTLRPLGSVGAPRLYGAGLRREGNAETYARAAEELIDRALAGLARGIRVGITTQRSSFVVWETSSGAPLSPLVSWQDRRAIDRCAQLALAADEIERRTGLRLSPHYFAPKLATLIDEDAGLGAALGDGRARVGTLDAYMISRLTAGRVVATDRTMAARTLLYDLDQDNWCPALLERFDVPLRALPAIEPTADRSIEIGRTARLATSIADQSAALLAVSDPERPTALVNLGTGTFVLRDVASAARCAGYLTGPILSDDARSTRYALEGPINGGGPALDRFGSGPTTLSERDPAPLAFAIPDTAGLGAPHWRPELTLRLSSAAEALGPADRRRVVLEGLLFRIREVLEGLFPEGSPSRIVFAGGLSQDRSIGCGLAAVLERPVERLEDTEAGLTATARLAAGLTPYASPRTTEIVPTPLGAYLPEKFIRWQAWLRALLESEP